MHSAIVTAAALAVLIPKAILADDISDTIVGCADIDCPTAQDNTTAAECNVAGNTYNVIGLAQISDTSTSLGEISWTEGIEVIDGNDQRTFEKNFYLGTLPSFNLTGTGACALFFTQVSDRVAFESNNTETAVGTCSDAMGSDCVNALIDQATKLAADFGELSSAEACANLQTEFENNLASQCASFATSDSWQGLTVMPLSGQSASEPITDAENSTSNCWPVLPKSDDLTLVASINSTGDFQTTTLQDNFYSIIPILTLFYPGNGSLISEVEAQLTCMKTVGPSDTENSTSSSTDENNSAVSQRLPTLAVLAIGLMFSTFLSL